MSNDLKPLVSVIILMAGYPTCKKVKKIGLLSLFETVLIRQGLIQDFLKGGGWGKIFKRPQVIE